MKKILLATAAIAVVATSAAAGWFDPPKPTSDKEMTRKVEDQSRQIDQMTGYPSIVNGFEKRMVRMLYEKRDDPNYSTVTYVMTMTGKLVKICDSVGYGINASIQFSNPMRVYHGEGVNGKSATFIPQAEPNGLFPPEGLAATYVMCVDNKNEELVPVYLEPEIIVSPFPLTGIGE